jgi:hypothetical protein
LVLDLALEHVPEDPGDQHDDEQQEQQQRVLIPQKSSTIMIRFEVAIRFTTE